MVGMDTTASSEMTPPQTFDLIAVGNVKVDILFSFYQDSSKWRLMPRTKEVALRLGEKIAVDQTDYTMGGNAHNVSVGLSRLGYSVALMAELGDDAFADDVERNLMAEGVSGKLVVRTMGSRTSVGVIMNMGVDDRTLLSQHVARNHPFSFEGVATRLLYLTSIGNAWEHVYQKTLDFALANKVPIAFNPGTLQLREQPEVFWNVLKHTHILCVNKEEAVKILEGAKSKLLKAASKKEPSVEEMMEAIAELGPKIVILTDGKEGSHARAEDGRVFHQETIPAVAVERTGAGDSFMAGVMGAALAGKSLQEAMLWGTRNAAAVVGKIGAQEGLLNLKQMESNVMDMRLLDLGYGEELIILPFDHRQAFAKYLFKVDLDDLTDKHLETIRDFKSVIYAAVKRSLSMGVPRGSEAVLVDEETGLEVMKAAQSENMRTILSVEKSGGEGELAFEYGAQYHQHIDKFKPTFTKVQVFYNMADSVASRKRQQAKLKELADYSHERGYKFLLELLIRPTEEQLHKAGGSQKDFDIKERPVMLLEIIKELQEAGVEPDVWNIEGLELVDDYKNAVKAIKADGREQVSLIVLGRGASPEQVDKWLEAAAGLPGVIGFAVGRTVFWDAIADYYKKKIGREEAIEIIANNFTHFYEVFSQKVSSARSAVIPSLVEPAVDVNKDEESKGMEVKAEVALAEEAEEVGAVDAAVVLEDHQDPVEVKVDEDLQAAIDAQLPAVEEDPDTRSADESRPSIEELAARVWQPTVTSESKTEDSGEAESGPVIKHGFEAESEAGGGRLEAEVKDASGVDDDEEDDDLPMWAVRRPESAESVEVKKDSPDQSALPGEVKAVVGGFSIEPSFEVPEDEEEEEAGKKGLLGRLFGK